MRFPEGLGKAILIFLFSCLLVGGAFCITDAQEKPISGARIGNRCFNGKMWKYCGEADPAPPISFAPNPPWKSITFSYTGDVTAHLNTLSLERSVEAKVLYAEGFGFIVWYR